MAAPPRNHLLRNCLLINRHYLTGGNYPSRWYNSLSNEGFAKDSGMHEELGTVMQQNMVDLTMKVEKCFVSAFGNSRRQAGIGHFEHQNFASIVAGDAKSFCYADLVERVEAQLENGKYHNLLNEVVATPEALFIAYERLRWSSNPVSVNSSLKLAGNRTDCELCYHIARQLIDGSFDVQAHCHQLFPANENDKSFRAPSLHLKVIQQAVRMVLEIIYECTFSNMSHGGRPRRGRHTALKDIKYIFRNPAWWMSVGIHKHFGPQNMLTLISVLKEKIEDNMLFELLNQMFQANILNLDFGKYPKGQGFPHEGLLTSILMNIYLDQLDQEILQLRLKVQSEDFHSLVGKGHYAEISNLLRSQEKVPYKPPLYRSLPRTRGRSNRKLLDGTSQIFPQCIKLYACRYVDEILLATTGPKEVANIIQVYVIDFLQSKMDINVNTMKSKLRNSISEKVCFLNMEIQAVPVAELPSPRTDKEIRAIKKHRHRAKMFAMQQQTHSQTALRKLGSKLLMHATNKAKDSNLRKQPAVDEQLKDMLTTWTQVVVKEFMEREEDRNLWFEKLYRGDINLNPQASRQLPQELLGAYEVLQQNIKKYLASEPKLKICHEVKSPSQVKAAAVDNGSLCIMIYAPVKIMLEKLRFCGLIDKRGRPQPLNVLFSEKDEHIIQWFGSLARRWLNYFSCCCNFLKVKSTINYHVRWSCLYTLAAKYNARKRDIVKKYTKELHVHNFDGTSICYFPSEEEIKVMKNVFLTDPLPVDSALHVMLTIIAEPSSSSPTKCAITCCPTRDTCLYMVCIPQKQSKFICKKDQRNEVSSFFSVFSGKKLPLCEEHYAELNSGKITIQNVDIKYFLA